MAVRDYTARILDKRAKQTSFDNLDYTPIAIPVGSVLPETTHQTMARMMLSSGMISLDDYQKMIGVVYDGDFGIEQEDFNDDGGFASFGERFQQSSFAEYENDRDFDHERPRMEAQSPGVATDSSTPANQATRIAPDSSSAGQSVTENQPQGSGQAPDAQTQSADANGGHL